MNIGSFLHRDQALYGVFNGETVAPASPGLIAQYPTLRDLLDAEKSEALKCSVNLSATIPIAEITFQPPIPNPRKIICVGMNYLKPYPVDGVAPPSPEHIILFGKESETLVGHGATLEAPRGTPADSFDYEGEIAVVVRKTSTSCDGQRKRWIMFWATRLSTTVLCATGKNIRSMRARILQIPDHGGPGSPPLMTLPRVEDLHLTVTLNGDMMQSAYGREMIFSLPEQIAYASSLFTLHPGDVIATGSPDGTGGSLVPKRYLRANDVLTISIQGIGTLSNAVS